jgi:hypothetical protein
LSKVSKLTKLGFNYGLKCVPLKQVRGKSGEVSLVDFVIVHILSVKKLSTGEIFHEEM